MQIHDHQNGFVQDKSTNDGILLLKRSQQVSGENRKPLFTSFVDCSAAFDKLWRRTVFLCVRSRFPPGQDLPWLDILEHLYSRTYCRFPKAAPTATFPTTGGTRQGGPESQYYFHSCSTYACEILWNAHGLSPFQPPTETRETLQKVNTPCPSAVMQMTWYC